MNDSKTLYRLNEQRQQERLNELAENGGDVSDISREIVLARYLLQGSLAAGNVGLSQQLLLTIDRLCKSQEASRYRANELLEKSVILKLAADIVSAITREFIDYPDGPEKIDKVSQQLVETIAAAKNRKEIL